MSSDGGRAERSARRPVELATQPHSAVGSLPTGYWKFVPFAGTLSTKEVQYRLGTLLFSIVANSPRPCMYLIAALTHLFIAASPLRMPIPHGTVRNLSLVSLSVGSCEATPIRNASSNMNVSARPSLTASTAAAVPSTSSRVLFLKQFRIHVA